jgi:LPS export ABC transporter protein LptC
MTLPKIMIYNCGIQTWRITSQKASLEKSESLLANKSIAGIQFSSGVILEELSGMTTALTVTTEELYFDSIQKTVSTKLEASVAGYQINHTAKGLFADLENNNLEFLSKNRGAHANSSF